MKMSLGFAALVLPIALVGCLSSARRSSGEDPNVLTRDAMEAAEVTNLYDAVQRLRPRWLQVRGGSRSMRLLTTDILVFQEQTLLGDIEVLRQLAPGMILSIRYLDGAVASATLPGIG